MAITFNGPYLDGDGGYMQLFDSATNLIGQSPVSVAGGYIGMISDELITRVAIVNTFGTDILFGIWNLEYEPLGQPAPTLRIARSGDQVTLSWTPLAVGYMVETTALLMTNQWGRTTNLPELVCGGWQAGDETDAEVRFYRLRKP